MVNGKYQEKMKRSVSQLSMILEGNRGMDKSKKENIYLALFLMFSEFITLGEKIKATLQISDSEEGKCIYSFIFFIHLYTSLITRNKLHVYSDR